MKMYEERMNQAREKLKEFLLDNGFEEWELESASLRSLNQKGFVMKTYTNRFNNYYVKCILVTPENVLLYGRNTPYNMTNWEVLDEKMYSSKEELLKVIKEFIYDANNVENLWA